MSQGLGPDTRLTFLPLSVVLDGEEFLVGHQASGTFVAMPEAGVRLLRELQGGLTVAEAGARLAAQGLEVDALDFAEAMVAVGFAHLGGGPVEPVVRQEPPRVAVLLFSRPAWAFYAVALTYCLGVFLLRPAYWPAMTDFFVLESPGLSLAIMLPLSYGLLAIHELFHGLAGRAAGVPVHFRVSRRLFLPVLETDLSALLSLPRRQRYGPYLAGMAWDTLVLAACLTLGLVQDAGFVRLAVPGLPAGIALLAVTQLVWQGMLFLRTDLYAVMVTLLGCRNLYRITYLRLKGICFRLSAAESAEMADAAERDLTVSRWFAGLYAIGVAGAILYLLEYLLPGLRFAASWAVRTLRTASLSQLDFWLALVVAVFTTLQVVWPVAVFIRERYRSGLAR